MNNGCLDSSQQESRGRSCLAPDCTCLTAPGAQEGLATKPEGVPRRYHFIPTRVERQVLAKMSNNRDPPTWLEGTLNGAAADTLENILMVSQKVKQDDLTTHNSTPRAILQRTENRCSNKNLYTNVRSAIHNSQKAETIHMSASG